MKFAPPDLTDSDASELHRYLVTKDPLVWFESHGYISTKQSLAAVRRTANTLQQRIAEVVNYCLENNLPIRIVVLKPRQRGISTITTAILRWLLHRWALKGIIVGGKEDQWKNLWEMVDRYEQHDDFDWGFSGTVLAESANWENGSILSTETAGAKDPGRSGTYHAMLCTEIGRWAEKGVKNAKGVLAGLLACVPFEAHTFVVLESTSRGASGIFFEKWNEAISFDDFKAGKRSPDGFVRVFAGWHEFDDEDQLDPVETPDGVLSGIGARNEEARRRERLLIAKHSLSAGKIKYYRRLLAECSNDWEELGREHPTDPDEAFASASTCRFNTEALRLLKDEAVHAAAHDLEWGMLDEVKDGTSFRYVWRRVFDDPDRANFVIHEHPIHGCRYSLSVDNAGGRALPDDERDTDHHAVTVIREGYFRQILPGKMQWQRPAVVATIKPEQRVDIDILTEWVWRLHVYYGRCLVVPEANNDRGLLLLLRNRGAALYEQDRPATQKLNNKPSGKLGFWTRGQEGEGTRNWIIESLARQIREIATTGDGIYVPFPWIVEQLQHFRIDPDDGKAKGMDGWHDDWTMALAIGMATRAGSTTYVRPVVTHELPPDLQTRTTPVKGANRI